MLILNERIYALINEPYISPEDEGYFILSPSGYRSSLVTMEMIQVQTSKTITFDEPTHLFNIVPIQEANLLAGYGKSQSVYFFTP